VNRATACGVPEPVETVRGGVRVDQIVSDNGLPMNETIRWSV